MKYSIIVTVYNKEKYLERCLKSACCQTFKDYSVIVVNDGSTDNSEKIIKKYQRKYKFKYYFKDNTGVADTRNFAISKVKSDYFLFLDADDFLALDLLEMIDKYSDYDVLSFNSVVLSEDLKYRKKVLKPVFSGNGEDYFIDLVNKRCDFTVPWGYVYRTDFFRNNGFSYPKGRILEDFYLIFFVILECKRLVSIDYTGYYYVETCDSIINSLENRKLIADTYLDYFDILNKDMEKYCDSVKRCFRSYLAGTLIWYGSKLKGREQRDYIKRLKSVRVFDFLDRSFVKIAFIKLLFVFNLYYQIRGLIKGDV